ncbi:MAG: asparagine synthase (glutamine-hydrolyzing) [archaeon]
MCGICGFNFSDELLIKKMIGTLKHRGPDQEGIFLDNQVSLGHTRLSIIDLSENGRQPMSNEDGTIQIVFNGEIYNFNEIKEKLHTKHKYKSNSDTEILLHLYEEKGIEMLNELNGMFAFCIYDKKKKILFCARDRFGKKPFYYSIYDKTFAFASEIKALLNLKKFDVNESSVNEYFMYGFVPTQNSIFKDINRLPAGSYLTFDLKNNRLQNGIYWDYSQYKLGTSSFDEYKNQVEKELIDSIRRRLISDVPLGVFLSGGIDSSLVLGCLSKIMDSRKISTFSIGFKEPAFDESAFSSTIAKKYKTNHHLQILSAGDCLKALPEIIEKMDEPISDPSIMPTYLLSNYTRKKVTVALSGDGADELFGGYPKYFISRYLQYYRFLPNQMKRVIKKILLSLPTSPNNWLLNYKIKKGVEFIDYPYYIRSNLWVSNFGITELRRLLNNSRSEAELLSPVEKYHNFYKNKDIINELMYIDIKMMLQDMYLVKVDRASMFNSLEVRSPFLDINVAKLSAQMESIYKVKGTATKYILKEIAKKYLPKELIYRKKRGFGVPLNKWIKTELNKEIRKTINQTNFNLNKKYALGLLSDIDKIDSSQKIWSIYIFLKWYERWAKN